MTPSKKKATKTRKKAAKRLDQGQSSRSETGSRPELCVFAFRLTKADRNRIHEIAGSAKASKFVIAATMAAVEGDVEAFKKVVASRATK